MRKDRTRVLSWRKLLVGVSLGVWMATGALARPLPDTGRPISLDDIIAMEGFGSALIDSQGKWLVYEKIRPYDQNTDFSFRSYAYGKSGHQLWAYDLQTGGDPFRVAGLDPEAHTYLLSFSPSGRYLAYFQYRFGSLTIGAYDLLNNRTIDFGAAPALGRGGEHVPVWISDDALVFSALPEGSWPIETSLRAQIGNTVQKAWQLAWRGQIPTAREVRTRALPFQSGLSKGRLLRADAGTGDVQQLAAGLFSDLRVSPDGKTLAGFLEQDPAVSAETLSGAPSRRRQSLVLIDLESGAPAYLAPGLEFSPSSLVWHPGGEALAAFGWAGGSDPATGRFHHIGIPAGEAQPYLQTGVALASERERGWLPRPERAVFFGDRLAVFARAVPAGSGKDEPAHWYGLSRNAPPQLITGGLASVSAVPVDAGPGHITFLAGDGLYRFAADGTRVRLTPELDGVFKLHLPGTLAARSGLARPEFSGQALFDVRGASAQTIVAVGLGRSTQGGPYLVEGPPDSEVVAGSIPLGIAASLSRDGAVTRLVLTRLEGDGVPREIDRANDHLSDASTGDWRTVKYTVKSGGSPVELGSCVLLPPGFDPGDPPPLVIDLYPGAGPDCLDMRRQLAAYPDPNSPHIWSSHGYAYSSLSLPTALLGDETGPLASVDFLIDAGTDALIAEGYADPDRLILHGFSLGGISALYAAAHAPRFSAVIAKHSWADLFSHYFAGLGLVSLVHDGFFGSFARYEPGAGGLFEMGGTPFEKPDAYVRNSPVYLARQIEMPVLLIGSDLDTLGAGQFDEMYSALLRAGKDAVFVRYLGEGHGLSSPANIRDMWERTADFLAQHGLDP